MEICNSTDCTPPDGAVTSGEDDVTSVTGLTAAPLAGSFTYTFTMVSASVDVELEEELVEEELEVDPVVLVELVELEGILKVGSELVVVVKLVKLCPPRCLLRTFLDCFLETLRERLFDRLVSLLTILLLLEIKQRQSAKPSTIFTQNLSR